MQPDPQRQWYIYHKEQELGPLAETDVRTQIRSQQFNKETYVFTEGMSDWGLVGDLPLFQPDLKNEAASAAPQATTPAPEDRAPITVKTEQISEPALTLESTSNTDKTTEEKIELKAKTVSRKTTSKFNIKKALNAVAVLLILGAFGAWWVQKRSQNTATPNAATEGMMDLPKTAAQQNSEATTATSTTNKTPQQNSSATAQLDWPSLVNLRNVMDPSGPPFGIAKKHLESDRPILVGFVSPLLNPTKLSFAIYPDPSKNLSVIPRVWFVEATVVDGFFTIGPFTNNGEPLAIGTYVVMAKAGDKYLDKVSFDVGSWPSTADLAVIQKKVENERSAFTEKELAALEDIAARLTQNISDLKILGKNAMPSKVKVWNAGSKNWQEKIEKLDAEISARAASASFYPSVIRELQNTVKDASQTASRLHLLATGGPSGLLRSTKLKPAQVWTDITKQQNILTTTLKGAKQTTPSLSLDPEEIKKALLAQGR